MRRRDLFKFFFPSKLLDILDWCDLYSGVSFPPENTVLVLLLSFGKYSNRILVLYLIWKKKKEVVHYWWVLLTWFVQPSCIQCMCWYYCIVLAAVFITHKVLWIFCKPECDRAALPPSTWGPAHSWSCCQQSLRVVRGTPTTSEKHTDMGENTTVRLSTAALIKLIRVKEPNAQTLWR